MAERQDTALNVEPVPILNPGDGLAPLPGPSRRNPKSARIFTITFDWLTLLLSGGVPYWFYLLNRHRFDPENGIENNTEDIDENWDGALLEEDWKSVIHFLTRVGKAHQVMVAIMLASLFPLISISPLPKCSWAYIFASLSLLCGIKTCAICLLYREHFQASETNFRLYEPWKKLAGDNFFHEDSVRLWVFLSLPTVWFTSFIMNYAISVVLLAAEEPSVIFDPYSPIIAALCDAEHTSFHRASIPLFIIAFIASLVYMKCAARHLTHL